MVIGGEGLSRSAARARRAAVGVKESRNRTHESARLGLTLRSVLLSPKAGFSAALAHAERRNRTGSRPAEGIAPILLGAIGGASLSMLWLKVGATLGVREVCSATYLTGFIVAAAVLGALLGVLTQSLWGGAGPHMLSALGGEKPAPYELRLVWGASQLPQVLPLLFLLPLDLLIVGRDTFTTAELVDPVSTAWAAFSIALGLSALVWTLFLLVRGVQSASSLPRWRAVAGAATALFCLVLVIAAFVGATFLLPEGAGCPTQLG